MISLEQLLAQTDGGLFRLARVAMIRANEIHFGSHPLVDYDPLEKETTIAFREIAEGKSVTARRMAKASEKEVIEK